MAWLEPADPYNPFTRRNYSGLTGWNLSNTALQNLASTTQSLVSEKKPEETPRQSSGVPAYLGLSGGEGIGGGGFDPGKSGYGVNNNVGQVLGNLATIGSGMIFGGPLGAMLAGGKVAASMITDPNRSTVMGISDLFNGMPQKGPEQYGPMDSYGTTGFGYGNKGGDEVGVDTKSDFGGLSGEMGGATTAGGVEDAGPEGSETQGLAEGGLIPREVRESSDESILGRLKRLLPDWEAMRRKQEETGGVPSIIEGYLPGTTLADVANTLRGREDTAALAVMGLMPGFGPAGRLGAGPELYRAARNMYPEIRYGTYRAGRGRASGGLLDYPTPGMADNINIGGNYVSGGEYIMPADVVSMLGDGNTEAGGRKIDEAIERLRKMKYGRKRQPPRFKGTLEDLL